MSYRHSSYRKLKKAVGKANAYTFGGEEPQLTRFEMDRVMHWSQRPPLPKSDDWGRPRAAR